MHINSNLIFTNLYNSESLEETITLSDDASNYDLFYITAMGWSNTFEVWNPNNKRVPICLPTFYVGDISNYNVANFYVLLHILDKTITKERWGRVNVSITNSATTDDDIIITNVIGIKK